MLSSRKEYLSAFDRTEDWIIWYTVHPRQLSLLPYLNDTVYFLRYDNIGCSSFLCSPQYPPSRTSVRSTITPILSPSTAPLGLIQIKLTYPHLQRSDRRKKVWKRERGRRIDEKHLGDIELHSITLSSRNFKYTHCFKCLTQDFVFWKFTLLEF